MDCRGLKHFLVFLTLVILSACATTKPNAPVYDPLENVNRGIYKFNTKLDDWVLRPLARGYRKVTPNPVEVGVGNFFNNLGDITVFVNDVLQGKFVQAASDGGRFLLNSTVGVLGIFDVATRIGLPKHNESFGQTFGVWGFSEGPYLMLPFFGPANVRSAVGRIPKYYTTYPRYVEDDLPRIGLQVVEVVSDRAQLLAAGNLLNQASFDPYAFLRDFWVKQHRLNTLDLTSADGDETDPEDDLDELDELDDLEEMDELDELDEDELDELDELDNLN